MKANMLPSLLPLLVIFTLDYTLWEFYSENVHPCSWQSGRIVGKSGYPVNYYPDIPVIFETLKNAGVKIAVFDRNNQINETIELIKLFGWDKYISFIEIYNKEINIPDTLFKLEKKWNIPLKKTIFFHQYNSIYIDLRGMNIIHETGVMHRSGMTLKILYKALREYNKTMQQEDKKF